MFAAILSDQHVQCSRITLEHLASMDKERNRCKLKAVMATQKRRRRVLKSQFNAAESSRRRREKDTTTYKSGGFVTELSSVAMKDYLPRVLTLMTLEQFGRNVNNTTAQPGERGRMMTG